MSHYGSGYVRTHIHSIMGLKITDLLEICNKITSVFTSNGGAIMPVIEELIKVEKDGSISFGNYELDTKAKLDNFDVNGDIYKVKDL